MSKAAVWGGTTTVLDFATQIPGFDLYHALGEAAERWEGNAYTDYSYHPIFTNGADRESIGQIGDLVKAGFPSFKIFTTSIRPPSPQMQNNKTDFGRLNVIMENVAEAGGILLVHSEDDDMVHYNYDNAREDGMWDWWNMHHIHSNLSEDVSFRRVLRLASKTDCPIYFVHVSAQEGVEAVGQARMLGRPVYGETLHNYACFSAENYHQEDGMKYHTYPSLKSEEDEQRFGADFWMAVYPQSPPTLCQRRGRRRSASRRWRTLQAVTTESKHEWVSPTRSESSNWA